MKYDHFGGNAFEARQNACPMYLIEPAHLHADILLVRGDRHEQCRGMVTASGRALRQSLLFP